MPYGSSAAFLESPSTCRAEHLNPTSSASANTSLQSRVKSKSTAANPYGGGATQFYALTSWRMGKKGALTEDGDERAAPIVLGVRGEEAVDADLLLRHQRLEEGGLGEAEPTRGGGGGGGRLLD